MKMPKAPEVYEPKTPIEPAGGTAASSSNTQAPKGLASFISAGRLKTKARTVKSSLIGG